MGSDAILFLCLLAVVLMIASEVTATDLAENTNAAKKSTNGPEESKYRGRRWIWWIPRVQNIKGKISNSFGISPRLKHDIYVIMGMQKGMFPPQYLGLPLIST
nr:uncharacterized protein LOC113733808 [Coffea arabica]